jgi:hypothetical protein
VASLAERGLNEVPTPADVARAVDQDECAHPEASLRVPVSLPDAVPCMERRRGRHGLIGSTTRATDVLVLVPDIPFSDDAPSRSRRAKFRLIVGTSSSRSLTVAPADA